MVSMSWGFFSWTRWWPYDSSSGKIWKVIGQFLLLILRSNPTFIAVGKVHANHKHKLIARTLGRAPKTRKTPPDKGCGQAAPNFGETLVTRPATSNF
jgi:hypothetical protein